MLALAQRPVAPDTAHIGQAARMKFFQIVNAWVELADRGFTIRPTNKLLLDRGIDAILYKRRSYSDSLLLFKQTPMHFVQKYEYGEDLIELANGIFVPAFPYTEDLSEDLIVKRVVHFLSKEVVTRQDFGPLLKQLELN